MQLAEHTWTQNIPDLAIMVLPWYEDNMYAKLSAKSE